SDVSDACRHAGCCPIRHRETSCCLAHRQEADQKASQSRVRHDQVQPSRILCFLMVMFGHHQKIRGERHQFPRHQECQCIPRKHDQHHCGDESVQRCSSTALSSMLVPCVLNCIQS